MATEANDLLSSAAVSSPTQQIRQEKMFVTHSSVVKGGNGIIKCLTHRERERSHR